MNINWYTNGVLVTKPLPSRKKELVSFLQVKMTQIKNSHGCGYYQQEKHVNEAEKYLEELEGLL